MTNLDIFAIKERIVTILKADTTNLWDSTPSSRSKFRKIEAGAPSPKAIQEPPLPRCYVTSDINVANKVRSISAINDNAHTGEEWEINLQIYMVLEAKDGPKTEENLDDLTKAVIEQLETNYDLRTVGGAESTRLAEKSDITGIQDLPAQFKGDRVRGRVVKFKVWIIA